MTSGRRRLDDWFSTAGVSPKHDRTSLAVGRGGAMRVVLIDASARGSGDAFVPAIVDTLRADPVIDRIVHVSWPLGPTGTLPAVGDGSRAAEIEKLADQMHLADAVVTVPWTIGTPSTLL